MTNPGPTINLLAELARDPASGLVRLANGWYQTGRNPGVPERPTVRTATVALEAWGIVSAEGARAVLSWSTHFDELTPDELAEVVAYFAASAPDAWAGRPWLPAPESTSDAE